MLGIKLIHVSKSGHWSDGYRVIKPVAVTWQGWGPRMIVPAMPATQHVLSKGILKDKHIYAYKFLAIDSTRHICVINWTITGSDKGLSFIWHKVIIWADDCSLFIGSLEINFSLMKTHLKMPYVKRWPFCLGLDVLIETVSPEGTYCDTVQVPSDAADMELI